MNIELSLEEIILVKISLKTILKEVSLTNATEDQIIRVLGILEIVLPEPDRKR